ncbi:DUF2829 domain-containing protein [Agrobacterium pusense]|uniref:DUF2829 domain-containing protein n=1 Tax=Agrobacterium pusense TaxID=648995 RepID=A0A6H0ZMV9_9HYPH|nr:MW1434 family type I TA system toxin [Agrobacterium pusense]QIX21397.1 DUF2829 domain-containing protein [Agrobacterium pusense]
MNYGQAIEAMKKGGAARRVRGTCVQIVHRGSPLQYFEITSASGRQPYVPTVEDQLAEDWNVSVVWAKEAA